MQLTYSQADKIATAAAQRSLGFGPRTGKVTVDASEIIAVAVKAAWSALQDAGLLRDADKRDTENNAALANAAKKKESAIRERIGV